MPRPSYKELDHKIKDAKDCIKSKNFGFEDPPRFVKEALELNLSLTADDLLELLDEVKPEHYFGARPPLKAYETKIRGCELFIFKWDSVLVTETIFLKFAFNKNKLWLSSVHKDRPKK